MYNQREESGRGATLLVYLAMPLLWVLSKENQWFISLLAAHEIVKTWMNSPAHRAWLLNKRVKRGAVEIWIAGRDKTFASWSFEG